MIAVGGTGAESTAGAATTAPADMRLTRAALAQLFAQNLTVQALGSGAIVVYSVAAADVAGVTDTVALDASGALGLSRQTAAVFFQQASVWRALRLPSAPAPAPPAVALVLSCAAPKRIIRRDLPA